MWFPVSRTFPRVPFLFALPDGFALPFEWLLSSILVISLILTIFSARRKIFLIAAVASLAALCFFDYLRFQPWTYQYLLIFIVICWHDWETKDESAVNKTLGLVQILIAGIYIWSGIQKMNYNFAHDILPALFVPVQNLFPTFEPPFVLLGIVIPLTESLIGVGLLFRKTRNIAVVLAVLMHAIILSLLIAKNYNQIIWVWNLTLIFADLILFWRNPVSLRETIADRKAAPVKLIVFAAVLLPVLNFFGYWDYFLSGAYYSGNIKIPVIRINEEVFGKLPLSAQKTVFQTKTSDEKMLPLFEWSIADTNAPVYLEERVFRRIALEICKLASDKTEVELIIRERPAILDGSYNVKRITCADIEKDF
jgi:hypothetical protein